VITSELCGVAINGTALSPSETFVGDERANNSENSSSRLLSGGRLKPREEGTKFSYQFYRSATQLTLLSVIITTTRRAVCVRRRVWYLYPGTCRGRKGGGEQGIWHQKAMNTGTKYCTTADSTLRAGTVILMTAIFAQTVWPVTYNARQAISHPKLPAFLKYLPRL
jgi:hypothetical protein